MILSSVVLPHPDGPRKTTNSAAFDVEGDGIEGREVTEALGDALQAQQWPVASRGAFVLYHHAGPAIPRRPAARRGIHA